MGEFLARHVKSLYLTLFILCIVSVGVAFASSDQDVGVTVSWGTSAIALGLIGQLIGLGVWIGVMRSGLKSLEKAVESIGRKRDGDKACLEEHGRLIAVHGNTLKDHAKEIDTLRQTQSGCKWTSEEPGDFIRKNGKG